MKQTVTSVHLLQKIVHLRHTQKKQTKTKNKKTIGSQTDIVWDPYSHHGSVKQKKYGIITVISQDQGPRKRTQHWKPVLTLKKSSYFYFEECAGTV